MKTAVITFCMLFYIYFLTVLKRARLAFFYFLIGSVGLFCFLMICASDDLTAPLTSEVCAAVGIIGQLSHLYASYSQYSILFISSQGSHISMFVDFECSGVIEMMAYVSLLLFYPVYDVLEKIYISILGVVWIFMSNAIRVLSICFMVYLFGGGVFYLAHAVVSRMIFYSLSIILYFLVFTRTQIIRQRVGGFSYGNNSKVFVK